MRTINTYLEDDKSDRSDAHPAAALYRDEELIDIIDHLLNRMDTNKDGYVTYAEYKTGNSPE